MELQILQCPHCDIIIPTSIPAEEQLVCPYCSHELTEVIK